MGNKEAKFSTKAYIVNYIILKILNNDYKLGDKIPSENVLADKFKCSRLTARSAILVLEYIGALSSLRGSGHFVTDSAIRLLMSPLWIQQNSTSFKNIVRDTGSKIISCLTKYFDENNNEIGFVYWDISKEVYVPILKNQYKIDEDICNSLIKSGVVGVISTEAVDVDPETGKPVLIRKHFDAANKFIFGVRAYYHDFVELTHKEYKKL